ncbi:hypothetical protein VUR80DRAFT_8921 [Thermomyces stellatus]
MALNARKEERPAGPNRGRHTLLPLYPNHEKSPSHEIPPPRRGLPLGYRYPQLEPVDTQFRPPLSSCRGDGGPGGPGAFLGRSRRKPPRDSRRSCRLAHTKASRHPASPCETPGVPPSHALPPDAALARTSASPVDITRLRSVPPKQTLALDRYSPRRVKRGHPNGSQ